MMKTNPHIRFGHQVSESIKESRLPLYSSKYSKRTYNKCSCTNRSKINEKTKTIMLFKDIFLICHPFAKVGRNRIFP